MNLRRTRMAVASVAMIATTIVTGSCSANGSHELTCTSTEVSPNTQPGSSSARAALDWYLENSGEKLPTTGFSPTGSSDTRHVYSNGTVQISVAALPGESDSKPLWVVTMIYRCS